LHILQICEQIRNGDEEENTIIAQTQVSINQPLCLYQPVLLASLLEQEAGVAFLAARWEFLLCIFWHQLQALASAGLSSGPAATSSSTLTSAAFVYTEKTP